MGVVISCWGDREPGKCQALGVLLGEVAVCIQRPVDVGDLRSMLETQSVRTCLRLGFVKENSDRQFSYELMPTFYYGFAVRGKRPLVGVPSRFTLRRGLS